MNKSSAFSLMELMIAVAIIAILAGLIYPSFGNILPTVKDSAAVTKAEALNTAAFTYLRRIPNATTNWTAADNAGRYLLLYNAGYLPSAPATLASYQPSGYSYTFPSSLTNAARVSIIGPSGSVSY